MKKLLTLACAALATTAFAADPIVFNNISNLSNMPREFGYQGVSSLQLFPSMYSTEDGEILIYDKNLNQLAQIAIPGAEKIELKNWYQERKYTYGEPTLISTERRSDIIEIDGKDTGITLSQAINFLENWYVNCYPVEFDLNGETVIVTYFYNEGDYGKKYPHYYYKLVNGRWCEFEAIYERGNWGPYGDWGEVEEYTITTEKSSYRRIYGLIDGLETNSIPATQTVFNADSKFEYLVPKYSITNTTYEYESRRGEQEKVITTGFSVMSEDGSKLYDIDIPNEYYEESPEVSILVLGDKDPQKYLVIASNSKMNDNDVVLLYALDDKGSISSPKIVSAGMKVNPTMPRHGESVRVDLGEAASHVDLISANGAKVRSVAVKGDSRSVVIPTEGLASGVYVVTANSREAAKIIIR